MRYTPQGTAVTNFSVAVTRKWNGGEETVWFRVSAWERLAEICNQYLSKGKQVFVEGRMKQPNVYTDKNGVARASLEITATNVVLLGKAGDEPAPPERNAPETVESDGDGDEIPF
jgi:single-strand DNA-binding protein